MKTKKPTPEQQFAKRVGKRVAKFRRKCKLTQQQLANQAGCGLYRQLISRLEKGEQMPGVWQLKAIADVMQVSLEQLVDHR